MRSRPCIPMLSSVSSVVRRYISVSSIVVIEIGFSLSHLFLARVYLPKYLQYLPIFV